MDRRVLVSPESAQASDIFDKFCTAATLKGILNHYRQLCSLLKLKATHFPDFYPRIRQKLCSWRAQGLWSKFEKRATNKCYARGKACAGSRVLIIGGGPCGLRTAIEAQLLGAKVVLVEKRDRFSRNNVLHLWPFVIADLKALGAKKFYGKFCAGSIDHISIRQLQCILLKVALLLGVEVHEGVGFEGLKEPTDDQGWSAITSPIDHPVSHYSFNCLIGADGRRNTLDGFKRKALRAKLAIAITANFINKRTEAEARVKEISGVSYIFNQKFFQDLNEATGIDLENIVYYKDETHYFVMTAKKQSLLSKGVLLNDYADTAKLLSHENISTEALMIYSLEAAVFSTENQLSNLEFAVNHYGQPDVAMFDFTAMYAAENACRVIQRNGHPLMMTLVGDSLLEPFWPTGSGCARGFLSSFDACWMLRGLASGSRSTLEVIAERESIYRLLGQTTPENLNKEHLGYTLDPHTRYPNLNQRVVLPFQVKSLFDTDEKIEVSAGSSDQDFVDAERATKKRRRDSVVPVDTLLCWLRDQVQGYGLEINSVTDSFVRGDVLCAIIHRFRPDLIEFPPVSEENVDPLEMVAQRNQMAFDFLHKEYRITPVLTGEESVHVNPSDFHTLVAYLSQLYDTFKGEIPQIKYPRVEGMEEAEEPSYRSSHSHVKYGRPTLVVKQGVSVKIGRRTRVSSSGEHSDASKRHRKRRTDERSRVSAEEREKHRDEIEKNRLERQKRRMQERMLQTERFIKSMRMLQMNDRSQEASNSNDDAFEDYTFHLYRQMAPDFDVRCKSLEQKLFFSGREIRTSVGGSQMECEKQHVTGLAKNLEEKLKGTRPVEKKPKDMIRAIGKIEKSDWNVQLIEKKIAESKGHGQGKKEQDKVPKWSREAYDDKREAMKRKMEGVSEKCLNEKAQLFEDTVKKLGNKLKEGNTLDVGQRGCNKVSQMAEQLSHKLDKPNKEAEPVIKQSSSRPAFEFPTKGGSEPCHFCNQRVYVVERMTTEGKYFHRNCFRCEYCNTSLRLGNYVFDREGRYGERFYCAPHYTTIKLYGWKKYDQECSTSKVEKDKFSNEGRATFLTPNSHQMLSEMDDRGTTPERVEFENSVDFASEEELLSEMDEDEWTDRNFGASNVGNNTSDEASDLSDDDEITPEGNTAASGPLAAQVAAPVLKEKVTDSSDSDTEKASGTGSASEEDGSSDAEDANENDDDEEDDEEGADECEGSTTEVETDSEFAEDPPHCVPGSIPTIVVNEPEQLLTKVIESGVKNAHAKSQLNKTQVARVAKSKEEAVYGELPFVEPVLKNEPLKGRALPKVYSTPKKWEPLSTFDAHQDATNVSLELKKKYLQGVSNQVKSTVVKKAPDTATQNQFSSLLDMISEKQKLLQPASKPSPSMQAFLEGAEKLKNKMSQSSLGGTSEGNLVNESQAFSSSLPKDLILSNRIELETLSMNLLNLEKTNEVNNISLEEVEKSDPEKEIQLHETEDTGTGNSQYGVQMENLASPLPASDTVSSQSQSKTESQCTIVELNESTSKFGDVHHDDKSETESDAESILVEESVTDTDEDHLGEDPPVSHYPPRVEIEDEFGVSLSLEEDKLMEIKHSTIKNIQKHLAGEHPTTSCGMSSSDSKDSLNSGAFLETELSEWSRETGAQSTNKTQGSQKLQESVKRGTSDDKNSLELRLEALDFADVDDGITSEIVHQGNPALTLGGSNSSTSSRYSAALGSSGLDSNTTKNIANPIDLAKDPEIVEVINPLLQSSFKKDNLSALKGKEKFALLDRVVPFSKARDSLDYRKMKSITNPLAMNTLVGQNYSSFAKQALDNCDGNSSDFNQESKTSSEGELTSSSLEATEWGNRIFTSPVTARRLHEISKERSKQSDLIRSMVMGRIRRSPEKSRRGSRGSTGPVALSTSGSSEFKSTNGENIENETNTNTTNFTSPLHGPSDVTGKQETAYVDDSSAVNIKEHMKENFESPLATTVDDNDLDNSFDLALRARRGVRSRPIFDSPLKVYQATTPETDTVSSQCQENLSSQKENVKNHSPSYYRSMPDLSLALTELSDEKNGKPKVNKVSSFATPNVKKWDDYRTSSAIAREKARELARERARLKSDEELGLTSSDNYDELKDKLKRKFSFAEDDVFNPNAPITTRVYSRSEPTSASSPTSNPCSYTIADLEPTNVVFDGLDNVAACIRQNVDFPMKKNPFLVSPKNEQTVLSDKKDSLHSNSKDDFLQFNLHIAPKSTSIMSPSKTVVPPEKFPNYFSTPSKVKAVPKTHSRSLTVSGIEFNVHQPSIGTSDFHSNYPSNSSPSRKDPNGGVLTYFQGHSSTNALSQSGYNSKFDASNTRPAGKTKALSTEMLLDNKFTLPPDVEAFRGVSVPDVTQDSTASPSDKKPKKSKDRNRRKSLIQAVSDFFTTKSPSGNKNSNSSTDHDKSSSTSSSSPATPKDNKFSIFKLTPKLLQKDKTSPPLAETSLNRSGNQSFEKTKHTKHPRASFMSYLSQPEMVLQKFSTTSKDQPGNSQQNMDSPAFSGVQSSEPKSKQSYDKLKRELTSAEKQRKNEIMEIQLQLESIETEQRQLDSRGVSIEKKLRGEEDDEGQEAGELMEEWFTLVREKIRLSRYEKELIVRAKELDLDLKEEKLEEELEQSILVTDSDKSPELKTREISLFQELNSLKRSREALLSSFHEDMMKYEIEDAELEARCSTLSPRESNV